MSRLRRASTTALFLTIPQPYTKPNIKIGFKFTAKCRPEPESPHNVLKGYPTNVTGLCLVTQYQTDDHGRGQLAGAVQRLTAGDTSYTEFCSNKK